MPIPTEQKNVDFNHVLSKTYTHNSSQPPYGVTDTYRLADRLFNWSILETEEVNDAASTVFRLDDVIADVITLISRVVSSNRVTISFEPNPKAIVFASQDLLFSMTHYLVSNAVKLANSGEKVLISSKIDRNMVIVSISNSGSSLSEQGLYRLFDVDTDTSSLGTVNEMVAGVEILLCHRFAEKNKGVLSVRSGDNQAITFTFTIPKVVEDS